MAVFYDSADMYDLFENEERLKVYRRHWETVFKGKAVSSVLDVSIGTGSVSLPMLDLGIELSGSDLSEAMLARCAEKTAGLSRPPALKRADFRDLSCWGETRYDCVASSGNSLPHVDNAGVMKALEEMDAHVKPGGYLYLDIRNWDRILRERQRFYLYNPLFLDGGRLNVTQVWDYNADGSMTFNILYAFEKDARITRREIFEVRYYPISRKLIADKLREMGYGEPEIRYFPACFEFDDAEALDWHSMIARKRTDA